MKITIDTKEDSHEEIRKVISLLSHLVSNPGESQAFNEPSQESSSAFADMFSDSQPKAESTQQTPDIFSIFSNSSQEKKEEEKKDEIPEIIPY